MWVSFQRFMRVIWPSVYRAVNGAVYFMINLLRSVVSEMIASLKGNG